MAGTVGKSLPCISHVLQSESLLIHAELAELERAVGLARDLDVTDLACHAAQHITKAQSPSHAHLTTSV